jgi:hypothetical protein
MARVIKRSSALLAGLRATTMRSLISPIAGLPAVH